MSIDNVSAATTGAAIQAAKSATRQLVLQAPAAVIADALGFSAPHLPRVWFEAGGSWTTPYIRDRHRGTNVMRHHN